MNTQLKNDYFFEMSMVGIDKENIIKVVNQGIDSRLTAFINSKFKQLNNRLFCWIHEDELEIMIRRLLELNNEEAELLADDIVFVHYGHEMW